METVDQLFQDCPCSDKALQDFIIPFPVPTVTPTNNTNSQLVPNVTPYFFYLVLSEKNIYSEELKQKLDLESHKNVSLNHVLNKIKTNTSSSHKGLKTRSHIRLWDMTSKRSENDWSRARHHLDPITQRTFIRVRGAWLQKHHNIHRHKRTPTPEFKFKLSDLIMTEEAVKENIGFYLIYFLISNDHCFTTHFNKRTKSIISS